MCATVPMQRMKISSKCSYKMYFTLSDYVTLFIYLLMLKCSLAALNP